jgi:hypothetical protein
MNRTPEFHVTTTIIIAMRRIREEEFAGIGPVV